MLKAVTKKLVYRAVATVKWPRLSNGVYVFNYHRIGDALTSVFDPNLYSCTAERFAEHLAFYCKEFKVVSVDTLVDMVKEGATIDKKYAVITFDDGYNDNYHFAYKLLKKFDLSAAFYIPTDYIDNSGISWWDEAAWIVRNSKVAKIKLASWQQVIDLSQEDIVSSIRKVLKLIKQDDTNTMSNKLAELASICQTALPVFLKKQRLFLSWDQIKEMRQGGMHIGSHGVSHNILAHLSVGKQRLELVKSKNRIEAMLSEPVTTVAYPVGGKNAFNDLTMQLAKDSGYELGFSFINGVICSFNDTWRYQLRRIPVDDNCKVDELKSTIVRSPLVK